MDKDITLNELINAAKKIQEQDRKNKKDSYFRSKVIKALDEIKTMQKSDIQAIINACKSKHENFTNLCNDESSTKDDIDKAHKEFKDALLSELKKHKIMDKLEKYFKIFTNYQKVGHSLLANKKLLAKKRKLCELASSYVCILEYGYNKQNCSVTLAPSPITVSTNERTEINVAVAELLKDL